MEGENKPEVYLETGLLVELAVHDPAMNFS